MKTAGGGLHRHSDGANGTRPKNGMQSLREYGLLAPEEPADDTASAGTQVIGSGHEATRRAEDQG